MAASWGPTVASSGRGCCRSSYSAVKVPFLLFTTFLLSLPSFFVVNTLLGLRSDFSRALRALLATQAGLTIILSALAPYTAFWYVSGSRYQPAILFNGMMFAVASVSAQWMLRRSYQPLIAKQPEAPLDAASLAGHLRVRGHPDGLGAPPVHRRPGRTRSVLPRGELEQCVRSRDPDDLGRAQRPREKVGQHQPRGAIETQGGCRDRRDRAFTNRAWRGRTRRSSLRNTA